MIVNWKKKNAGVLVLPLKKNGVMVKKVTILPGYNEVADDDWDAIAVVARKHVERGDLEKIVVQVTSEETEESQKGKKVSGSTAQVSPWDNHDYFPYRSILTALSVLEVFNDLTDKKKEEDGGNGALSKAFLLKEFAADPELFQRVKDQVDSQTEDYLKSDEGQKAVAVMEKAVAFNDLEPELALEVVAGCFIEATLNKWKKNEGRDEVRAAIANQLQSLKEAPKKKKKPKGGRE